MVPDDEEARPVFLRKGIAMKRFLALVLFVTFGTFIIGCETKTGTDVYKTQTTTTQTKDGKVIGQTKTTTTDATKTTSPTDQGVGGATTEKKTQTITETTK
jgi:hypothetical protein